jgi:hypothetical protein
MNDSNLDVDLDIDLDSWCFIEEKRQLPSSSTNRLRDANGDLLDIAYMNKYRYGQFLAHDLPYRLSSRTHEQVQSSSTIPVLNEDINTYEEHECSQLVVSNLGLVGYVLVPKNVESNKVLNVKIVFRGTNPNSYPSVSRDIYESQGAGYWSFEQNKNLILQQIAEKIELGLDKIGMNATDIPVNITIAGHSLGGADAQNCLTAIMQTISENHGYTSNGYKQIPEEISCNFTKYKVNKLRLFNYNSAGVPDKTKDFSIELAKFLHNKRTSSGLKEYLPEIETYNYLVNEDIVQQTGEAHVLDNVPEEYATVDVLKVDNSNAIVGKFSSTVMFSTTAMLATLAAPISTSAATTLGTFAATTLLPKMINSFNAHTKKALLNQSSSTVIDCVSVNNSTPEGQLETYQQLSNKSNFLNKTHNISLAAINSITSLVNCGLKLIGIDNEYKFINKKIQEKVRTYDDKELLKLIIKNTQELMDACKKNSDRKKNSYYGMLTFFRNQVTSYWSLSDKVWYACESFLSNEIHNSKNYLKSFELLQKELAEIANQYGDVSAIKPILDQFINKQLTINSNSNSADNENSLFQFAA